MVPVSGLSGVFAVETSSKSNSAAPATPDLLQSTDVQVNWSEGDVYPETTQSETSIQVNPNTGTICVAYNDRSSDGKSVGYSRSTDGGATFVDGGYFPDASGSADPSLAWRAADGSFYFAALKPLSGAVTGLWRSTDDCETFSYLSNVGISDRAMMVIDNNPGSPYYGRFYITGSGILFYSDNGTDWFGPFVVSLYGNAPWPAVDPVTGDVYIAATRAYTEDINRLVDIEINRSTDGGATWDTFPNAVSRAVYPYDAVASDNCDNQALNGDIRHVVAAQIVVDSYRNLHVVYARDPVGAEVGDVSNVYYRRSIHQGLDWEQEVQLNDDGTLTDQWFPTVSVGPSGTVVATWYDRRNDPDNNLKFDYYMATSLDNGVTWGANIRVSDVSSDLAPVNPNFGGKDCYHGDYDQQVQHGAFAYIVWSDDRNIRYNLGDPPEPYHDPDVWFDKVLVTPESMIYLPIVISQP